MFQTPNMNATCNDPASWITTGTPNPGSPDLKTVEMLATIAALTQAYNPGGNIATVGPAYANYLLLPDGQVTADLSLAQFESQWMADNFAALLSKKIYLILYWGPRCPPSSIYATTDPAALAIHNVQVSSVDSVTGSSTASQSAVDQAIAAATAQATTTQPTAPVATGVYANIIAARNDPAALPASAPIAAAAPKPTVAGGAPAAGGVNPIENAVPSVQEAPGPKIGAALGIGLALLALFLLRRKGR